MRYAGLGLTAGMHTIRCVSVLQVRCCRVQGPRRAARRSMAPPKRCEGRQGGARAALVARPSIPPAEHAADDPRCRSAAAPLPLPAQPLHCSAAAAPARTRHSCGSLRATRRGCASTPRCPARWWTLWSRTNRPSGPSSAWRAADACWVLFEGCAWLFPAARVEVPACAVERRRGKCGTPARASPSAPRPHESRARTCPPARRRRHGAASLPPEVPQPRQAVVSDGLIWDVSVKGEPAPPGAGLARRLHCAGLGRQPHLSPLAGERWSGSALASCPPTPSADPPARPVCRSGAVLRRRRAQRLRLQLRQHACVRQAGGPRAQAGGRVRAPSRAAPRAASRPPAVYRRPPSPSACGLFVRPSLFRQVLSGMVDPPREFLPLYRALCDLAGNAQVPGPPGCLAWRPAWAARPGRAA